MNKHGIDMQVLSLTAPGLQMQPDTQTAVAELGLCGALVNDHTQLV
ncbi:MAG TPA: hypothetical protein VMA72_10025 [Streptosporangiaceae bacterium]|nr:hypothetical protein [Streptosporangiaceae bacterium]